MKKYVCDVCGYIYDPAVGDPDNGIEPGTAFEDLPNDWVCPLCGVGKEDFSPVEEQDFILFRYQYKWQESGITSLCCHFWALAKYSILF